MTMKKATLNISMHFKTLKKDQEEMIKEWLKQDYITKYWYGVGLQNTLTSIERFVNGMETSFTLWVAYDGKIPFGYLMTTKVDLEKDLLYAKHCELKAKAITLDLLIGNPSYLGRGLSHIMITEFLFQKHNSVTDVFIDPQVNNSKAIHVYEKAGFQRLEEFIPEWDPTSSCLLMQLKMEQTHTNED